MAVQVFAMTKLFAWRHVLCIESWNTYKIYQICWLATFIQLNRLFSAEKLTWMQHCSGMERAARLLGEKLVTQDPVSRDIGAVRRLEEGDQRHVHVTPPSEQTSCSPPSPRTFTTSNRRSTASRNMFLPINYIQGDWNLECERGSKQEADSCGKSVSETRKARATPAESLPRCGEPTNKMLKYIHRLYICKK